MTNRTFDVVIVGGGLLGLTAALAFSKLPLKVGLISAQSLDKLSIDHLDLRVSAIHQGSEAFLKKLNIFQQLPADRMGVFERIFVWEEMGKEHIDFSAHENRQEVLGHIIENNVMQFELYRALKASAVSLQEATCTEIEPIAYGWKVQLSQGEAWETQLLVGADGAHSFVRQAAGMSTKPVVYGQDAIIATVNVQHPHANTAYQRFLKTGPLAFLPLTLPHQCSIVWTLPTLEADQKMALSEKDFNEAMTQALAEKLGQVSLASKRLKFPLMHHHASTYVAPGLALVGDAAHVIHPLAGLGANLGFADVEALFNQVNQALQRKRPAFSLGNLKKYEQTRHFKNEMTRQMMSGLNALFAIEQPQIAQLRRLGMKQINQSRFLKRLLMDQADGVSAEEASIN